MARNLDHRIEVVAPVENARVRQEANAILDSALADTTNSWELASDGTWARVLAEDVKPRTHQETMMRRVRTRARRRERDRRGG
jgi:polyphosphate kinase